MMHSSYRPKRSSGIFRTPRFLRRFRRNTQAVSFSGNKVELFRDGGDFFPAMFREFAVATRHRCIEFYIFSNDRIGQLFADALINASKRGVTVYLMYDYLGSFETPGSYFRRLEDAGITCIHFNRPSFRRGLAWLDRRNHRKFAVIDGTSAFLGGMNIGDEYDGFGDSIIHWRDVGIRLEGAAVGQLQKLFINLWESETGTSPAIPPPSQHLSPAGDAEVMVISGGPHHTASFIRSSFRMAIAGAAKSVRIVTPYFVPGPRIVRSLLRATKRGVQIQLLLPAITDVPLVKIASRAYLSPLLKAGIEIYERQGTILHAKVMLIDCCWATVGSANFDLRSFHRNYEVNVVIDSPEFGRQIDEMFTEELALSRRITLLEHEKRPWFEKTLERLCDPIRRFL
ncbi:MAG: cardiolipin synthase [Geobacteraceae bacterium]|nr:cardiolipin synthase [Geobacteraceae bacterium]